MKLGDRGKKTLLVDQDNRDDHRWPCSSGYKDGEG